MSSVMKQTVKLKKKQEIIECMSWMWKGNLGCSYKIGNEACLYYDRLKTGQKCSKILQNSQRTFLGGIVESWDC